jgi:metal-dependent amidase/aminoacylase/carboxypeptidase family protein
LIDEGVFDDVDFALMVHPAGEGFSYMKRTSSVSSDVLQVSFISYPKISKDSVSEAVAEMSSRISRLKGELPVRSEVSVERIDELCGWTEVRIRLIAPDVPTVTRLSHKVIFEAGEAAEKAGVSMHHRYYMNTYADMIWNNPMSEAFRKNLLELGEQPVDHIDRPNRGDEGNVSHVVPSICTWINASESPVETHAKEFAEATITDAGHEAIILGAKALAMTAIDLFTDRELVKEAISDFSHVSPSRFSEIQLRNCISINQ